MTNIKSKCCNAEVKAVCSDDFGDKEDRGGQTCHYECLKCGEACDIQTENTNIIEELSDLELSLEAEKDENGKIRASWVKEFILISLSRRDKEWEEKIKNTLKDIQEIIKNSKATFFVKDENTEIPMKEALYELKAEISDNVGMYFYKKSR